MKVLICYTRFPWPTVKGDLLTVFKLLEFLSARHEVDFLCWEPADLKDLEHLPKTIRRVVTVKDALTSRLFRIGRALFTGKCLQIESFFSPQFAREREKLMSENSYDIVYSHYIRSFGGIDFDAKGAKKVIGLQLSHQAHFAKAALKDSNPVRRFLYGVETKRLETWEGRVAQWNDLVHLISPRDMERIKGYENFQHKVFFNPHGVDPDEFVPALDRRRENRIVFTGNLGFQANEDAILWFAEKIWPLILRKRPATEWVVAGSRPTAAVRKAIAGARNASLEENPKYMWDVIQQASVSVDPLRIGAGLQNKILEALSCGVPAVATSLANEGIGAVDQKGIVLRDREDDFADAVITLLDDKAFHQKMSQSARDFICAEWSWDHHFIQAEERWKALLKDA